MNEAFNPFVMAQQQFDHAANLLGLEQSVQNLLRSPMREFLHVDDLARAVVFAESISEKRSPWHLTSFKNLK